MLDVPEFYEALSLAERAAFSRTQPPQDLAVDHALAEQRVQVWRDDAGFSDETLFAQRLAVDDLDEALFLLILGETAAGLRERCKKPPAWFQAAARGLTFFEQDSERNRPKLSMPLGEAAKSRIAGYLEILNPLLADAYARLQSGIRLVCDRRPDLGFDPAALCEVLVGELPAQLLWMVSRSLTLELHLRGLEEQLEGETPEARFAAFVDLLRDRATVLEIFRRYPVLLRNATLRLEQWITTSLEFLERWVADRDALVELLSPGRDPGVLVKVYNGLSDRHDNGRAVLRATFESGLELIYKPRSLAAEERFQNLLAWLDDHGHRPSFRRLKVLDRRTYGWVEYVAPRAASSTGELERFYERQGAYAALLYALQATDFHHENLIAAGEHPVLIDLETLFQPFLPTQGYDIGPEADFAARTVLRSGLLPRRIRLAQDVVDVSALGATRAQTTERYDLVAPGTDQMRHVLVPAALSSGDHLPGAEDQSVEPWDMADVILRGFRRMYRLLARHREELLAAQGPLLAFADTEMRVIARPTEVYARLLVASHHPDLLRNALRRDRLFDKLWLDASAYPFLARVIPAELESLARGDVPRFVTRPGSRDLHTSSGKSMENVFGDSGLELVCRRIAALDEEDLERQTWLVRATLDAGRPAEKPAAQDRQPLPDAAAPVDLRQLQAAARAIGRRLRTLAVRRGEFLSWFQVSRSAGSVEEVGSDLYSGLPGIALFLAQLGSQTLEDGYEEMARAAWTTARRQVEGSMDTLTTLGAWNGWGGLIYASTCLGLLWNETEMLEQAEEWVPRLSVLIEHDELFDVVGGAAGALVCLLELHRHRPSRATLEAAVACGDHLVSRAVRGERGLGWPSQEGEKIPLNGLGHGAAGGAWALSRLAAATGAVRFRDTALDAMAYERTWFCPRHQAWPDLRHPGGDVFFHAWCHGGPGIGLGRLGSLPHPDEAVMCEEIRAAGALTLKEGFGKNHSLCHGDLGNLDFLLKASDVLGDAELRREADQLAQRILAGMGRTGWRFGTGANREVPGLMTGLAGIGYGLLRAATPASVPCVLLLETSGSFESTAV